MTDTTTHTSKSDFTQAKDPFALLEEWLAEATASEPNDANAMSLATVDPDGLPNVRVVLLKDIDPDGLAFYTNLNSAKGQELDETPKAAVCFHWKSLRRQVRARGPILPVSDAEADAYYDTRPRGSRIGAWASRQSKPLESRAFLQHAVKHFEEKFEGVENPPRPEHWSGFQLLPTQMEFWQDGEFRLHDRIVFTRDHAGDDWVSTRLFP